MAKFSKGCYLQLARAFKGAMPVPVRVSDRNDDFGLTDGQWVNRNVVLACVERVCDVLQADNRAFDRALFVAMVQGEAPIAEPKPNRRKAHAQTV